MVILEVHREKYKRSHSGISDYGRSLLTHGNHKQVCVVLQQRLSDQQIQQKFDQANILRTLWKSSVLSPTLRGPLRVRPKVTDF